MGIYPAFEMKRRPSLKLLRWIYTGYSDYRVVEKYSVALDAWGDDIVRPVLLTQKVSDTSYREKEWLKGTVGAGLSLGDIAKACGCSESVICRWVKRHGIDYIPRTNSTSKNDGIRKMYSMEKAQN